MAVEAQQVVVSDGDHRVLFYDRDADLTATVAAYLAAAIDGDEVALVIATPDHRDGFEQALAAAGLDVVEAKRRRTYVAVDAATTLSAFVIGGEMDVGAFGAVIGGMLRSALETGRPVRAYGEMVALLWDAGDVMGAVELESWWSDLGRVLPFSLLCAYPSASVSGPEHAEAFGAVCHLHHSVAVVPVEPVGPARMATRSFAADLSAPRSARVWLIDTLRQWGCDDLVDAAAIVLTELATNAVLHTGAPFTVVIASDGSSVRLSVGDVSPVRPVRRRASRWAQSGRGLGLVEALATRWGADETAGGKVVWAELGR